MGPDFGAAFSITGAFVYYLLAGYIFIRRDKNISHYIFIALLISLGFSETMAFFEFTGTSDRAYNLLKFDLSSIAIGAYLSLLFAEYFRSGFNWKFAIASFVPTVFVIYMVFTVMIIDMEMGPYGWAGVYHETYHLIYSTYALGYITIALGIFLKIYKAIVNKAIKSKIRIFIIATSILLLGGFSNAVVIITIGRVFPIVETSLLVYGAITTFALTKKSES